MRAVVFDLDHTLADVERDRATLLAEATADAGAPRVDRAAYLDAHRRNHAHRTRTPIFAALLDGEDADPEAVAAAYRAAIGDALEPVAGVEALVADLRESYRVGLLTNGPVLAQRDKLATLGWTDLFDATVVTGELGVGKPDERAFHAVLDDLGVDPAAAVYVGDEPEVDVRGATDAGLRAVQVLYPGGPDPHPDADATVRRDRLPGDLPDVLAAL